jgi:hypothetical protein
MRKLAFVLAMSMVVAGTAFAIDPTLSAGGGGSNPLEVDPTTTVCWSQAPNLDGLIGSSEVITAFALETELANDFLSGSEEPYIVGARWWGGYYNYVPGDPLVTSFNLRFYDDAGCIPGSVLCEYVIPSNANETFIYNQGGLFPVYEYDIESGYLYCPVAPDVLYWFGVQAGDHPFPPQWGRIEATGGVQLCDTVFKGAIFSFPDWTPAVDVFGVAFDASQELICGFGIPPFATVPTTWGTVKVLFR